MITDPIVVFELVPMTWNELGDHLQRGPIERHQQMDIRVKPTGTIEYRSGPNWIALHPVRWFLRQAGRWRNAWHRFVQGVTLAGETITLCLGLAARNDIIVWLRSHNGDAKARAHLLCRQLPRVLGFERAAQLAMGALR